MARAQKRATSAASEGSRTTPGAAAAVEEHMLAAQQAQGRKDYAAAEREYRAVIALAPGFAEARMNLGLLYQLQNQRPQAMSMFEQALKLKPDLTGANFFLGVDYCQLGEGAEALPFLRTAARQKPDLADVWSWLATAYEMTGQISSEVESLHEGLRLQPQNVDLLYLLGHAYERLGREQVATMEKAAPGSSYVEQLLAESYASSGEWADAELHLQNALTATPDRAGLHLLLGEVLLGSGNLKRAAEEFDTELRLYPENFSALVRRGEVRLIQEDLGGALDDWSRAIAIDEPRAELILGLRTIPLGGSEQPALPDSIREMLGPLRERLPSGKVKPSHTAAVQLARAFIEAQIQTSGRVEVSPIAASAVAGSGPCSENQIRTWLHQGRASSLARCSGKVLTPQTPDDLRLQVAVALYEAGEYDRALAALAGLSGSQSHTPEAGYLRANCYKKLATEAYLKVFVADPNSYRVHQLNGDMFVARREDERAMEEYRAAIALKPAVPNLHYSLGHLLWKKLKTDEAREAFEAELDISPRHPGALEDLGATYLFEHQPTRALPYLRQASELEPDNTDVHRDLGTAYVELGDYASAERELKLAVLADHDGSVHYKLGKVYQALGRKVEATREFDLSTALNAAAHRKAEERAQRLGRIDNAPAP